jgi:glutamate/tyrosine decarboxylase-like PLP-dependent enzyme
VTQEGLWNNGPPMILSVSDQIHHSVFKAAGLLGLGQKQVRITRTSGDFKMDLGALRRAIEQDKREGLRPFCVVASAGTVNTGAVDPLMEIAALAREFGLWFHVDGAYGAPAAIDANKRDLFKGIEQADSLSVDAHKWLYVPVDCGCLLFRDPSQARAAFSDLTTADYIKVFEQSEDESFAFWDYGVELSRRFRALKLWMTFKFYGTDKIAASISEDISLAAYMSERIVESPDFELLAPVQLSICCFRYVPESLKLPSADDRTTTPSLNETLDRLNERIMHAVQRDGRAYISNALLHGRYALRSCIVNFKTTRSDIDLTLEVVREIGERIVAGGC